MTEETKVTMKPEEAIKEICSLQLKQNQEIKQLQEEFKAIQGKITASVEETNTKMEKAFEKVNDKLTSHVMATTSQINVGLNNIKDEMSEIIEEHTQKLYNETKIMNDRNNTTFANVLGELQKIRQSIGEVKVMQQNDEPIQHLDNNQHVNSFSLRQKQTQQERDIPSPRTNNDSSSIHTNPSEINGNKIQTILLSTPTTAPIFHGKLSERPWQFLIRIEEYTETVHNWGEDMLLRGISQFLKDTALEWYCQLRSCHYLPGTWTEFKQIFMAQFNSPIRIAQQKQQWKECRQNKDETINEFIVRLRALWAEQFPHQTEADLIKHLFCKMRPDMLNIMGCPRNAPLQEILLEAQRVEEILYYRTKQDNQMNKALSNTTYNNNNVYNRNANSSNHTNEHIQSHNNTTNNALYQQMQRGQTDQQRFSCYKCGRSNHRARDCWYSNEYGNNYAQQSTSFPKNE